MRKIKELSLLDEARLLDITNQINTEKNRLVKIFKKPYMLDGKITAEGRDRLMVIDGLISNAAFMKTVLSELRDIINRKGYTEVYKNGENQTGIKKSSEVDIYNTMIKNYTSVIKQLTDLLPEGCSASDELTRFIKAGGR